MPNYRNETRRLRVVDVGDTALIAGELVYRDHTEGELGYAMRRSNVPRGVHRYSEGNVYRLNRYDADGNPLTGGTVTLEIEEVGGASRSWFHLADGERLYRPLEEAGGSATYLGAGVWRLVTPTSDIFSASSATAGLIGDPYVSPLIGGMYKLPADNLTYRLLETPELVVNAKMDLLHGQDRAGTEAWEREWRQRYGTAYRTPGALLHALPVRADPVGGVGVDLETLEFVRPAGGCSWSRAASSATSDLRLGAPKDARNQRHGGVFIRREGRCARLDALWDQVAAPRPAAHRAPARRCPRRGTGWSPDLRALPPRPPGAHGSEPLRPAGGEPGERAGDPGRALEERGVVGRPATPPPGVQVGGASGRGVPPGTAS